MMWSFSNLWRYGLRGRSLRTYLVLLVLAATLPLALFAGLVFWWNARLDSAAIERDMRDMARLLKIAVEREVGTSLAVLETIATSPHLETGDLKSFHELVSRAAESREGMSFALFERGGRQLLNTRRPFAAPLPSAGQSSDPAAMHGSLRLGSPETIKKVFETARPAVSDLFESQLTRRPALGLIVPVIRNGQVRYALGMTMQPETFNRLLQDPSLPATWHSVILDRRGVIIARKYDAEKYIGRSAPAQMVGWLPNTEEGWGPGRTLDGLELYSAFTRSQLTGWTVMIGAPESALGIETQRSARMMTTGGAVLLLIALVLAVALGRRIAAPIFGLAASAEAIQRGQQLDLPPAGVLELDHLRSALLEAGAHARASMQERERRIIAEAKQEEAEAARAKIAESEALLRKREQQLALITDATPALISYIDREQRYRFVNREYERWFGHPRGDVVGRTMTEVLGESAMERLGPHVTKVLQGEDVRFELETPYRDGGTRWVYATYVPERSASGEVAGFFVLVLDITQRKRAEDALAEAVRQREVLYRFLDRRHETTSMREIFDAALDAIISALRCDRASILLLDATQIMRFVAWRGLSREYRDAVDGHTAWQPDDPDPKVVCIADVRTADLAESLKSVVTREGIHALAFIPLVLEGRLIGKVMAYFNEPHHFTGQEIELSVAIARQIALAVRRFRIEEALRESEENYRAVVESQAEMVCRFRADGTIVFVNGAYARARATTVDALVGQSFWGFIDAQDRPAVESILAKLTPESPEVRVENRFETNEGARWTLWTNRAVTFDDGGRWLLAQSTGIDITDRKRAEEEIQRLNAELEERVEQRTRQLSEVNAELEAFSYSISHDLRAPLRAMEGYAKALADDYADLLDSNGRDWLERISRSAHRLDTLISDVLAYSRVAKEAVALAPVDLERLIEDIQSTHPDFQAPHAQIVIQKPLHAVVGHEAYLTQSITNLLANAVKFVENGVIPQVSIRSEQSDGRVRIWFEDNGIGIDPSHQERIFQIFGQVHPNGRYAGTGIGLAIVRKAVQRMNGEVGVESEPGKGSGFWLLLEGVRREA